MIHVGTGSVTVRLDTIRNYGCGRYVLNGMLALTADESHGRMVAVLRVDAADMIGMLRRHVPVEAEFLPVIQQGHIQIPGCAVSAIGRRFASTDDRQSYLYLMSIGLIIAYRAHKCGEDGQTLIVAGFNGHKIHIDNLIVVALGLHDCLLVGVDAVGEGHRYGVDGTSVSGTGGGSRGDGLRIDRSLLYMGPVVGTGRDIGC